MKFGFSTLGCPELSYAEVGALAQKWGLDFLELRTLEKSMDLPAYFAAHPPATPPAVPVLSVACSLSLATAKDSDIETAVAFARVADQLGASYLRIFGGGGHETEASAETIRAAAASAVKLRAALAAAGAKVEPLLETHDSFSYSRACVALNQQLEQPLGILWDTHHTWKIAGETLAESWALLGPLVRHVHCKDSVPNSDSPTGYTYVPQGRGTFPGREMIELLKTNGYAGGVSLEWEKQWHPELAPLNEVLADFKSLQK